MSIPPNAKKVFSGIIFDVYQWPQIMFDGSIATFEKLKRPDTVTVIPTQNGKVIIAREQQPGTKEMWTLFGGRLELGEDPQDGARRELAEESGLVSDEWELFRVYTPVSKIDWNIYVYIAKNCRTVNFPHLDAGERIVTHTLSVGEFINLVRTPEFADRDLALEVLRFTPDQLSSFKKMLNG